MESKHKKICLTIQILLWVWFGTITSFVANNVVNIAKLETESKSKQKQIENLETQLLLLKYNYTSK